MYFMNIILGIKGVYFLGMMSYKGIFNLGVFSFIVYVGVNLLYLGFIMWFLMVFCYIYYNIQVKGFFIFNFIYFNFLVKVY